MQEKTQRVEAELLSPKQCGVISNESSWTWRARAYRGVVASVKMGRLLRIPAAEVRRLIDSNTRPAR
ncbi:MAG TPA: hypothetical protein VFE38_00060 [Edaphobacter sp.]|nr:hypothetical protein [Edaphobacter sp.]